MREVADEDGAVWRYLLPKAAWGDFESAAPVKRLDLASEVTRWAGVRTAAELVPVDGPSG